MEVDIWYWDGREMKATFERISVKDVEDLKLRITDALTSGGLIHFVINNDWKFSIPAKAFIRMEPVK